MNLFINDESGYLAWIQQHPSGWVVNADSAKSIVAYPMVHRASHRLLSSPTRSNYTTDRYIKACSDDVAELEAWSIAEYGKPPTWCGTCAPSGPNPLPDGGTGNDAWSDAELRASVAAYLEMKGKHAAGVPFVKKHYYDALSSQFGRTTKAFEYRMQNISHVLELIGRPWIPGLVPARNVGSSTAAKIEVFIAELEGKQVAPVAAFTVKVREASKKLTEKPKGERKPKASVTTITTYARDPAVKAWVLREAKGVCECCEQPAPFVTVDGPFLEVHHVRLLAEQGPDTVCNAVALCPNCHRRLHYGLDAAKLIDALYKRIARLKRSVAIEMVSAAID